MPLVSVIMSTYNRASMLKESIDSVLNQSFSDFEFIIINDASTDNTDEIIRSYSDKRIRYYKNKKNCGCTFNYHNANNLSNGTYIAHLDDDDIFFDKKLEKQVEMLNKYPGIIVLGTFIETFGEGARPSWVFFSDSDYVKFLMNFYNPVCHSSIMYRKSFLDEHAINYDISKKCAQDYDFYKQIILNGGNIYNMPEVLVKYRMHANRLTDIKETQNIQIKNAEITKNELLSLYFDEKSIENIKKLMDGFPFNEYDLKNVEMAINLCAAKIGIDEQISKNIILDIKNNKFRF